MRAVPLARLVDSEQGIFEKIDFQRLLAQRLLELIDFLLQLLLFAFFCGFLKVACRGSGRPSN